MALVLERIAVPVQSTKIEGIYGLTGVLSKDSRELVSLGLQDTSHFADERAAAGFILGSKRLLVSEDNVDTPGKPPASIFPESGARIGVGVTRSFRLEEANGVHPDFSALRLFPDFMIAGPPESIHRIGNLYSDTLRSGLKPKKALERTLRLADTHPSLLIAGSNYLAGVRSSGGETPLALGIHESSAESTDVMFATEDHTLRRAGFEFIQHLNPGEGIMVGRYRVSPTFSQISAARPGRVDLALLMHGADGAATIDGVNAWQVREALGHELATFSPAEGKVYPIPIGGNPVATGYASELELPLRYGGLSKDRYSATSRIKIPGYNPFNGNIEMRKQDVIIIDNGTLSGTTDLQVASAIAKFEPRSVTYKKSAPPVKSLFMSEHLYNHPNNERLLGRGRIDDHIEELTQFYEDANIEFRGYDSLPLENILKVIDRLGLPQERINCYRYE